MSKNLAKKIRNHKCDLCQFSSASPRCMIGVGDYPNDTMIIGEAPSRQGEQLGRPFAGKAAKRVLEPLLTELNIDKEDVYLTNLIKCRPPEDTKINKNEIEACRVYLEKELNYVKPKKIILLGAIALKGFLEQYNVALKTYVGRSFEVDMPWGEVKVLSTYHPAFILRKPPMKKYFKLHFKNFLQERKRTGTICLPWDTVGFLEMLKKDLTLDIETVGLDPHAEKAKILSIAATPRKGYGFAIDSQRDYSSFSQLDSILRMKDIQVVGHNLKFDLKWLIIKGLLGRSILKEDRLFDTMVAFNVLDENCLDKGLKSLSYQNTTMIDYEMPCPPDELEDHDIEEVLEYNCMDVDATKRLKNWIMKQFKKDPELLGPLLIDQRTTAVLTDMESIGVRIDTKALKRMKRKLGKKLKELEAVIPVDNVNASAQLAKMLVRKGFSLPKTKKGNYSATKEVLNDLKDQADTKKKQKVLDSILEYRKYFKLYSSFVIGIEDRMTEVSSWGGGTRETCVFPQYHVAKRQEFNRRDDEGEGGTVTGRLSCSNPNFQQLPRDKGDLEPKFNPRSLIIPHYGYDFIASADFEQVEMVLAGVIHGESKLVQMYEDKLDMHLMTAAEVLGKKPENVTKDERKAAKAINFGIIYGITEIGLARRLGWSIIQAKRFIKQYMKAFPAMGKSITRLEDLAISQGYVENYFHRRRRLPEASRTTWEGREMLRQAINSPVQGTSGDLTKICMWEIYKRLSRTQGQIIGQVHDEIVIELVEPRKEEVVELIKEVYARPPLEEYGVEPFPFALRGEIEIGVNWFKLTESIKF